MNNTLPDFLIIPSILIEDEELQPLDGYVYGVVYWYTKLKLERCIASNERIASLICIKNPRSVSNSLTRLKRKGFIEVVLDPKTNQRLEIIPLITFSRKDEAELLSAPSSNDEGGFIKKAGGASSNDEHNNNIKRETINNTSNKEISLKVEKVSIESITLEDILQIANDYQVNEAFVRSKLDDMVNYCKARGKKYKDYKFALRNWVKKDAMERREKTGEKLKYVGDAL
jgi:hypothetical protein